MTCWRRLETHEEWEVSTETAEMTELNTGLEVSPLNRSSLESGYTCPTRLLATLKMMLQEETLPQLFVFPLTRPGITPSSLPSTLLTLPVVTRCDGLAWVTS